MIVKYKNINPNNLLDKLIENNIEINAPIRSDLNVIENEVIANNVWVDLKNDSDLTKVNDIVENLNNSIVVKATTQEQINAQLLEEIAQQKIVNAQLMQEIATLKGGNVNV